MKISETPHLDALVTQLHGEFRQPRSKTRVSRVVEVLRAYADGHLDWREFLFLDPDAYTRNLVVREESFELLILGWSAGQETPIHNHEGEDCWMAVLEGSIEEVRYSMPTAGIAPEATHSSSFQEGQVAFIRDEIGLHLVRSANPEASGVSLHLYSSPYDACDVYCPETGEITRRSLTNYSERGTRLTT